MHWNRLLDHSRHTRRIRSRLRWPSHAWMNRHTRGTRLLLYGVLFACFGLSMYLVGVLISIPRHILTGDRFLALNEWLVWYSGVPLVLGIVLALIDLLLLLGWKRSKRSDVRFDP